MIFIRVLVLTNLQVLETGNKQMETTIVTLEEDLQNLSPISSITGLYREATNGTAERYQAQLKLFDTDLYSL